MNWSNRLFGKKLNSFRAISTSVNLSVGGALLISPFVFSPEWCTVPVAVLVLFLSLLPALYNHRLTIIISYLPIMLVTAMLPLFPGLLFFEPLLLLPSVISDYLTLFMMRKLFASISKELSIRRIITTIVSLVLLSQLLLMLPLLVAKYLSHKDMGGPYDFGIVGGTLITAGIAMLNVTTLAYA